MGEGGGLGSEGFGVNVLSMLTNSSCFHDELKLLPFTRKMFSCKSNWIYGFKLSMKKSSSQNNEHLLWLWSS